ncbi:MAG: aminoacyl-histidine dipeptidase [Candidatus Latescibacteria bacterium]|nr:aminoacyl-histidine dipeptidase [Candidatus Latescibacterota bacterium]
MSSPLTDLEPRIVWGYFDEIRKIPRPSKHEEKIQAWLKEWASEHGLEADEDQVGNLVVRVPATQGHEEAETVVLQGHVDMVPEKNRDVEHDFLVDPIEVVRDGDWVLAQGTTLGSDNGVGVSLALAAATDPDCVHPPLELLFTVDEETGLTGATELDDSLLNGRRLLNLDTEEDGAFYIGCAGGNDLHITFNIERQSSKLPEQIQLLVRGLRGGHSGVDIHENRANAVKLLFRLLKAAKEAGIEFEIASVEGGSKHNAIPREAFADLRAAEGSLEKLKEVAAAQKEEFDGEFGIIDPDLVIEVNEAEVGDQVFTADLTGRLVSALLAAPHGVLAMSREVAGLVETSNNVAVIKMEEEVIDITTSTRSSVMPALRATIDQIRAGFELAGANVEDPGGYPGWTPDPDSPLLNTGKRVFQETFGREPEVKAIHAGLECGIIGEKFPGMDMLSFGPEISSPHAPGEKVQISSVEKTWKLLKAFLLELA